MSVRVSGTRGSVGGLEINTTLPVSTTVDDPFVRLYQTPKSVPRVKVDEANQALVSDLPTHTLKWIKKRRSMDTDTKVVLSPHGERQLRGMFNSLDINKSGTISLTELTEAIEYVQTKTKGTRGLEAFQNIAGVFAAMDDNGDGTIDFNEFTHGMTGTANSAFEKASPYDIEKLFSYFVEFGERKQREHALRRISEGMTEEVALPPVSEKTQSNGSSHRQFFDGKAGGGVGMGGNGSGSQSDASSYQSFKTLFGSEESTIQAKNHAIQQSAEYAAKKAKEIEDLLEEFLRNPVHTDDDYAATEIKLKEIRKQQMEVKCTDPDLVALAQRLVEKKKNLSTRRSYVSNNSTNNSTLSNSRSSSSSSFLAVKDEQALKMNAKREAYDALRGLTAEENQNLMATARAVLQTHSNYNMNASSSPKNRLAVLRGSQQCVPSRNSYSTSSISLSPTKVSYLAAPSPMNANGTANNSPKSSRPPTRPAHLTKSSLVVGEILGV